MYQNKKKVRDLVSIVSTSFDAGREKKVDVGALRGIRTLDP